MGRTACTEPQCLYKGDLYLYITIHISIITSHSQDVVPDNSKLHN